MVPMENLFVRSPEAPVEPERELNSVMKEAGGLVKATALESVFPMKVVID